MHPPFLALCLRSCVLKVRVEDGLALCSLAAGNFLCPYAINDVIISAGGQSCDLIKAPNHSSLPTAPDGI